MKQQNKTHPHQRQSLCFSLLRLWQMQIHFVTIEIGIVRRTHAFVEAKGPMGHYSGLQLNTRQTALRKSEANHSHTERKREYITCVLRPQLRIDLKLDGFNRKLAILIEALKHCCMNYILLPHATYEIYLTAFVANPMVEFTALCLVSFCSFVLKEQVQNW